MVRVQLPNPASKNTSQQVMLASPTHQVLLSKAQPEVNQVDFSVSCKMLSACQVKLMPAAEINCNTSLSKISLSWPGLPEYQLCFAHGAPEGTEPWPPQAVKKPLLALQAPDSYVCANPHNQQPKNHQGLCQKGF